MVSCIPRYPGSALTCELETFFSGFFAQTKGSKCGNSKLVYDMSESLFCNELGGYEIGGFGHFHGIRFDNPKFSGKSIRQNPLEARTVAWFLVSKAAEHVPLHSAPFEHGLVQSDSEIS